MHPWSFRASFDTGAADRNDIQIETELQHAILNLTTILYNIYNNKVYKTTCNTLQDDVGWSEVPTHLQK